jgi:hypothetical protein
MINTFRIMAAEMGGVTQDCPSANRAHAGIDSAGQHRVGPRGGVIAVDLDRMVGADVMCACVAPEASGHELRQADAVTVRDRGGDVEHPVVGYRAPRQRGRAE